MGWTGFSLIQEQGEHHSIAGKVDTSPQRRMLNRSPLFRCDKDGYWTLAHLICQSWTSELHRLASRA
jgi:hypothetical protein